MPKSCRCYRLFSRNVTTCGPWHTVPPTSTLVFNTKSPNLAARMCKTQSRAHQGRNDVHNQPTGSENEVCQVPVLRTGCSGRAPGANPVRRIWKREGWGTQRIGEKGKRRNTHVPVSARTVHDGNCWEKVHPGQRRRHPVSWTPDTAFKLHLVQEQTPTCSRRCSPSSRAIFSSLFLLDFFSTTGAGGCVSAHEQHGWQWHTGTQQ